LAPLVPHGIEPDQEGSRRCPEIEVTKPIKKPKATWVEPSFQAEVEYRDITKGRCGRTASSGFRK
jgi:hypothetical protein